MSLLTRKPGNLRINLVGALASLESHNQESTLPECLDIAKSTDAEYVSPVKPRRASPVACICFVAALVKDYGH